MLELRHNRQTGQNSGNDPFLFRDGTRVVVMDNGFSIFSNGDDLDLEMVDQSGYWFGRTLANHLNNHPSALSWWQEENKIYSKRHGKAKRYTLVREAQYEN